LKNQRLSIYKYVYNFTTTFSELGIESPTPQQRVKHYAL
jgi:hypothetical protein